MEIIKSACIVIHSKNKRMIKNKIVVRNITLLHNIYKDDGDDDCDRGKKHCLEQLDGDGIFENNKNGVCVCCVERYIFSSVG